jgi:hypothetical protein
MYDEFELKITLTERMLGTIPRDREVLAQHVMDQKEAKGDEIPPRTPEDQEQRAWTTFYVDENELPVLFDYQLKGFLKEAANDIKDVAGPNETKIASLRSHVERSVFILPRMTPLQDTPVGDNQMIERPLRAMTQQGPRVTVVRSDYIEAGQTYTFKLLVLKKSKITEEVLLKILSRGQLKGLGQWRNGGYGRFDAELTPIDG